MKHTDNQYHIPVLLDDVLTYLDPQKNEHYLDLTAGYGGHAQAILDRIGSHGSMTLVDRDQAAISVLEERFKQYQNVTIIHGDFLEVSKKLYAKKKKFDLILADLGVSSVHLNNADRGFSFNKNGPLDMRMDRSTGKTAADVINEYSLDELIDIFQKYGEIRSSKKMATYLIEHRPYSTTTELAERILTTERNYKRTHPATKIFQALRIEVNEELKQVELALPIWRELLQTKGRIGVISFHSLEDRLIKRFFKEHGTSWYDAKLQIVTKNAVIGSDDEIVFNPRARSAKLRVAQRK